MVMEDYKMAKIFVSSTYTSMWKKFGHEMYACIFEKCQAEHEKSCVEKGHTHTHTHTDETISQCVDIPEYADHASEASEDSCESGTEGDEYIEEDDSSSSEESDAD